MSHIWFLYCTSKKWNHPTIKIYKNKCYFVYLYNWASWRGMPLIRPEYLGWKAIDEILRSWWRSSSLVDFRSQSPQRINRFSIETFLEMPFLKYWRFQWFYIILKISFNDFEFHKENVFAIDEKLETKEKRHFQSIEWAQGPDTRFT